MTGRGWTERIPNVTPADSANNNNMSDVVGNKTDTTDGDSIYANLLVPAADTADNVYMSDVVGNRTDAHDTTTLSGDHHMFHDHFHHVAKVIPSGTAAAQVTCGDAQAWDLGEFAVIAATNAIDDDFDVHFINVEAMSANATYELVLYSGADASEVEVGRIRFVKTAGQTKAEGIPFGTPMIAVNTQIKAKVMSSSGNADTIDITIHYHDY